MYSLESRAIVHCIDYDIVPKVETLCRLTEQAAERATSSGSAIQLLTVEQNRISELLSLLGHIKHIQTALSKLSVPNLDDQTVIECAALLNSVGPVALQAYEIRYGQSIGEEVREAKGNALSLLSNKLTRLFEGKLEETGKADLPPLLESFKLIGAVEEGQRLAANLFACQFKTDLDQRSALLANVQFPFNARLSMIFDLISDVVQWNTEHLSSFPAINEPLLKESSSLASDVLDQYIDGVLGSSGLTDLRLLDLALTEAVSLVRQSLAFKMRHRHIFDSMQDSEGTFTGCPINSSLARFLVKYAEREKQYFKLASTAAIKIAKDEGVFEDAVFIATKAVRRCISTMDIDSIDGILAFYLQLANSELIAIFKKLGERNKVLNCMATYSTMLENSVERLESDVADLQDDFWSSKGALTVSTATIRSHLRDIRRLSDSIESQLSTALVKQFTENKQFAEKLDHVVASLLDSFADKESVVDAMSTAIVSCCKGLGPETMRRVYSVVAQLLCDALKSKMNQIGTGSLNFGALMAIRSLFAENTDDSTNEYFSPYLSDCN